MTRSRMMVVVASAMVTVMAGCADRIAAPASADAERSVLVRRAQELKASVLATGSTTPAHARRLEALKADVKAWQLRTGRTDLAFLESRPVTEAERLESVSLQQRGSPSGPCVCVPVVVMGDLICFLEAGSRCVPGSRGGCRYACMVIS